MERVVFRKGAQRSFLVLAIEKLGAPSLRGLLQFGFDVKYSTLKNYFVEARLMPKNLFLDICELCDFNPSDFKVSFAEESWGQRKGGRKSKRRKA